MLSAVPSNWHHTKIYPELGKYNKWLYSIDTAAFHTSACVYTKPSVWELILTHWGRDKLDQLRRRHFQVHFLEWKYLISHKNFTEVCSAGSNQHYASIGSHNGLAPSRRQAIIWPNDGKFTDAYMRRSDLMSNWYDNYNRLMLLYRAKFQETADTKSWSSISIPDDFLLLNSIIHSLLSWYFRTHIPDRYLRAKNNYRLTFSSMFCFGDVSSCGHFGLWTFCHVYILRFWFVDVSTCRSFWCQCFEQQPLAISKLHTTQPNCISPVTIVQELHYHKKSILLCVRFYAINLW